MWLHLAIGFNAFKNEEKMPNLQREMQLRHARAQPTANGRCGQNCCCLRRFRTCATKTRAIDRGNSSYKPSQKYLKARMMQCKILYLMHKQDDAIPPKRLQNPKASNHTCVINGINCFAIRFSSHRAFDSRHRDAPCG